MNWNQYTLLLPLIPGRREAIARITARFPGLRVEFGEEIAVLGSDDEVCRGIRMWVTDHD